MGEWTAIMASRGLRNERTRLAVAEPVLQQPTAIPVTVFVVDMAPIDSLTATLAGTDIPTLRNELRQVAIPTKRATNWEHKACES